jgi:hypothetical protein
MNNPKSQWRNHPRIPGLEISSDMRARIIRELTARRGVIEFQVGGQRHRLALESFHRDVFPELWPAPAEVAVMAERIRELEAQQTTPDPQTEAEVAKERLLERIRQNARDAEQDRVDRIKMGQRGSATSKFQGIKDARRGEAES